MEAFGKDRNMATKVAMPLLLVMALLFFDGVARADDSSAGITVSGTAKVMAKPNAVEILTYVSGDAELTADAVVKYRDARKRAVAALDALKIPTLSIESNGFSVKDWVDAVAQQQAMMRGQMAGNSKQKVSVGEQLRLVLKDADKVDQAALMDTMLKVLDTAKDAGLTIGNGEPRGFNYNNPITANPLITFKVTDTTALREQAYKQAMDDAKAKAQRLADLAGVKIGRIISVRDGTNAPSGALRVENPEGPSPILRPAAADVANELSSNVLADIPLTVSLTVQFEIEK